MRVDECNGYEKVSDGGRRIRVEIIEAAIVVFADLERRFLLVAGGQTRLRLDNVFFIDMLMISQIRLMFAALEPFGSHRRACRAEQRLIRTDTDR